MKFTTAFLTLGRWHCAGCLCRRLSTVVDRIPQLVDGDVVSKSKSKSKPIQGHLDSLETDTASTAAPVQGIEVEATENLKPWRKTRC
jgi:hypothetical protein